MNSLRLSPFPAMRSKDDSPSLQMEREGFVDEAVVSALVTGPQSSRSVPYPDDLVLSVDDMDFAGWQLRPSTPFRGAEVPPQVIEAIVRRATPPVVTEPGLGSPHRGSHRWWLAGLAGALSTMLFSVLLLSLSSRSGAGFNTVLPAKAASHTKPLAAGKPEAAPSPQLAAETGSDR
jgi:hypothetical protein